MSDGDVIVGGVFSTVIEKDPVVLKPSPLTAVHVTVVSPIGNSGLDNGGRALLPLERYR